MPRIDELEVHAEFQSVVKCLLKDVTPEVFHQARIRSLFLRHAAITQKLPSEDSYAMAGIFSLLDCILDQPLDDALAQLPINPKIIEGILMETGDYGRLLKGLFP